MVPLYVTGFLIGTYLTATPLVPLDEMTLKWSSHACRSFAAGCLLMSILGALLSLLYCEYTLTIHGASQSQKSKPTDRQGLVSTR